MALVLSRSDVQCCLSMPEAIAAMRTAFAAISTDQAALPQRLAVELPGQNLALLMPSLLHTHEHHTFGQKLVTIVAQNPQRQLPRIHSSLFLLDAITGQTLAIMEGGWLTAMRTGAASGLATDLLARRDAHILALFGAGVQAHYQVLAIHAVRHLREVRVVNRDDGRFAALVTALQSSLGAQCPAIYRAHSAAEALAGASLVACATTATSPLFQWEHLASGAHINAIGAFTPAMCELDAQTLAHARIVVDQRAAALAEAGDLLQALAAGLIPGSETWSELGDLVTAKEPGRRDEAEITVFKSVGLGVQDVAVALHVYERAREIQTGVEVEI